MSNFNNASLILTPNAKKAGKLYALKGADLDVVRATSATYVGADGLIKTALANVPRLDYSNGSCPSILVEPQRTNLVFPSATATTQSRTVTAVAHTLSFYGTGTITLSGVATGTLVGTSASNRVTLTFTPTAGSLILTVTGSVTNWQLEAGANATSYIPTVASAVTRNADVISKTGISDLIGQTEGTIFADINIKKLLLIRSFISVQDSSYVSNAFRIESTPFNQWRLQIRSLSSSILDQTITTPDFSNGNYKVALAYSTTTNGVAFYVNGNLLFQTTLASIPNLCNSIFIGTRIFNGSNDLYASDSFNSVILFKTRLSNTELAQLTTL